MSFLSATFSNVPLTNCLKNSSPFFSAPGTGVNDAPPTDIFIAVAGTSNVFPSLDTSSCITGATADPIGPIPSTNSLVTASVLPAIALKYVCPTESISPVAPPSCCLAPAEFKLTTASLPASPIITPPADIFLSLLPPKAPAIISYKLPPTQSPANPPRRPPTIVPGPGNSEPTNPPNAPPNIAPAAFAAALPTGSPSARLTAKSIRPPMIGMRLKIGRRNLPSKLLAPTSAASPAKPPAALPAALPPILSNIHLPPGIFDTIPFNRLVNIPGNDFKIPNKL